MNIKIDAACGCAIGRIRSNNEDNFCFDGRTLEMKNTGLRQPVRQIFPLNAEVFFGVFDGMGGEESGEKASYLSAITAAKCLEALRSLLVSPHSLLEDMCQRMNEEVCAASADLNAGRMGSTAVMLLCTPDDAYVCNIGDSRAYRLRDNELLQISKDHVERLPTQDLRAGRKPRLTQHLGIFPDELTLEPHIAKCEMKRDDQYLLCSDGLTDMLSSTEICAILKENRKTKQCVETLLSKAMENGGRDNITVILCRVK